MKRHIILIDIGEGLALDGVLPSAMQGSAYSAFVAARGGTAPYTYTLSAGEAALTAAGINLNRNTGEFISSDVQMVGSFPITVRATDITGAWVERSFVIDIIESLVEVFELYGIYPDGIINVAYSEDLQIIGGGGDYSNARTTSGDVPEGLALSIVGSLLRLSGTPSGTSTQVNFTVAVDNPEDTASSVQSITITETQSTQYAYWSYKQIDADDATDYSLPSFDDSSWSVGAAPFGSWSDGRATSYDQPPSYDSRFAADFATNWDGFTRLWIRRTMELSVVPPLGYFMTSFIEDNAHVYVNGTLVFESPIEPAGGSGYITIISPEVFMVGENSLAVRCDDETYNGSVSVTYADFLFDTVTEHDVVASLLHFDGDNNSTSFVDEAGVTWQSSGDSEISTAQYRFGGSSLYLDGTGDRLYTTIHAPGTQDVTIEAWVRPTAVKERMGVIGWAEPTSYNQRFTLTIRHDSGVYVVEWFIEADVGGWAGVISDTAHPVPLDAWTHVACVRNGSTLSIYINGVLAGTAQHTPKYISGTTVQIGTFYSGSSQNWFQGYIDEARITVGLARYTSGFTPLNEPFQDP